MPSLTIKNIPEKIYKKLKLRAKRHKRSLNSEILECLESFVTTRNVDVNQLIAKAESFKAETNYTISDKEITELKRSGRR